MATPLMNQYRRIKEQNPGAVLLFRMGDFYELFDDDAVIASKILGIALTSRNHGESAKTALCGFPHHALDRYAARLIAAGLKIAICDQIQDPKEAKGIVERAVTEIITRGTATHSDMLKEKVNQFLVALLFSETECGFAAADVSTGEFFCTNLTEKALLNELYKLQPAEILFPKDDEKHPLFLQIRGMLSGTVFTAIDSWHFSHHTSVKRLLIHFGTRSLEGFGVEAEILGVTAAGVLLDTVGELKKGRIAHFRKIAPYRTEQFMVLDGFTIRNLELISPLHPDDEKGTLLHVLDRTRTAMGGRLLKRWIVNPLLSVSEIGKRQDAVSLLYSDATFRDEVGTLLSGLSDIERLNGKIGAERVNPRDLSALRNSLKIIPELIKQLKTASPELLTVSAAGMEGTEPVLEKLEQALVDEPPLSAADGGIFRKGFSENLDSVHESAREGKEWIAGLQAKERDRTGISTLKVGYNRVFGYFIEVSTAQSEKVPKDYLRKQTLANGERYITEELKKWEEIVLGAEERQLKVETELFTELRRWLAGYMEKLQQVSDAAAVVDCLVSLAEVASANNYIRPVVDDSDEISIEDGRHPVIENLDFTEEFVPNNLDISGSGEFIHLITGPNMAGKSTFLRQCGLIVLMAQMGGFVPARSASIGVVDRIFTRVGASDRLAKGQSTFLVEMQELANILNNATRRSLVLLDEIGRGTSTFDGLSIAWALVEYIHNQKNIQAKTLFATHYHELTEIPHLLKGVKNFNVAVKEWNDEIIFLRKIVEGACDHSYGIQVARLAGVPQEVIFRAREILQNLEADEFTADQRPALARHVESEAERKKGAKKSATQLSIFQESAEKPIIDSLRELDVNALTPLEALNKLAELKKRAGK